MYHIVQKLLKKGALVNVKGGKYGTAPWAEVNTECGQYENPFRRLVEEDI